SKGISIAASGASTEATHASAAARVFGWSSCSSQSSSPRSAKTISPMRARSPTASSPQRSAIAARTSASWASRSCTIASADSVAAGLGLDRHPVLDALERQRQPPALRVDLENADVHRVALRHDLARILDVMLRELGDVHEAFDAGEDLDERAERDHLRHLALDD